MQLLIKEDASMTSDDVAELGSPFGPSGAGAVTPAVGTHPVGSVLHTLHAALADRVVGRVSSKTSRTGPVWWGGSDRITASCCQLPYLPFHVKKVLPLPIPFCSSPVCRLV